MIEQTDTLPVECGEKLGINRVLVEFGNVILDALCGEPLAGPVASVGVPIYAGDMVGAQQIGVFLGDGVGAKGGALFRGERRGPRSRFRGRRWPA